MTECLYVLRNMDIVGVPEITAEAELLSAIVMFLENVGLTSKDVTIKVSSRKVLQAILEQYNVPADSFSSVCVVVDKLDKMPQEKVGVSPLHSLMHLSAAYCNSHLFSSFFDASRLSIVLHRCIEAEQWHRRLAFKAVLPSYSQLGPPESTKSRCVFGALRA